MNVLTGNPKEVPLLIQVTASLRNLASREYKQFLSDERLNALTNILVPCLSKGVLRPIIQAFSACERPRRLSSNNPGEGAMNT